MLLIDDCVAYQVLTRSWRPSSLRCLILVNALRLSLIERLLLLLLILVLENTIGLRSLKVSMIFGALYIGLLILRSSICNSLLPIDYAIHLTLIAHISLINLLLKVIAMIASVTILAAVRPQRQRSLLILQLKHFVVVSIWCLIWHWIECIVWQKLIGNIAIIFNSRFLLWITLVFVGLMKLDSICLLLHILSIG